jgi:magnesium chelatase family protein
MSCRRFEHNLLLWGPPGAGKSRRARRLTTILPAMTLAEALETTRIHSVAGLTGAHTTSVTTRPFRAPHPAISDAGLIGGQVPQPGTRGAGITGLVVDEPPQIPANLLADLSGVEIDAPLCKAAQGPYALPMQ